MEHLLLFYRVVFYTFGFSILGFTIYKYLKSKNPIVGSFLFFWSAMTATAAAYVVTYYITINLDFDDYPSWPRIQGLAICLIGIALPYFVHKILQVNNKVIIKIIIIIGVIIFLLFLLPIGQLGLMQTSKALMTFIVLSNVYSYIIALKKILGFNNKNDRRLGMFFMLSFPVFFGLLVYVDILGLSKPFENGFLFFPLFYMWVGGFFVYLGLTRLNNKKTDIKLESFIKKYKLTKRESEIALLLADGLTYKKIAEKLFISPGTVSTHVMHIYEKTGTSSKIQLNKAISQFK